MNRALARVAVALDTPNWSTFESWCDLFGPEVGVLKVGLEAFVRWGPKAVARAGEATDAVFLDLKLHDIPQTVAGATASACALGVRYFTVHAAGATAMLRAAVDAAGEDTRILAVTVLTHLDSADFEALDLPGTAAGRVARWARLARDAGAAGAVCSPQEARELRRAVPRPFELVTPGIRSVGAPQDDQARTCTAREALEVGSDLLVIGRPLTRAVNPELALSELASELADAAEQDES